MITERIAVGLEAEVLGTVAQIDDNLGVRILFGLGFGVGVVL